MGEFVFCLAWFADAIIGFADLCAWHGLGQVPLPVQAPPGFSGLLFGRGTHFVLAACRAFLWPGEWNLGREDQEKRGRFAAWLDVC